MKSKAYSTVDTKEAKELVATIKFELHSLHKVIDEYLQFTRLPKIKLVNGDINQASRGNSFFFE